MKLSEVSGIVIHYTGNPKTTAEGMFNEASYEKLVQLVAELCKKYELTDKDVLRHYDVTGKICPKYYVENEDAWEQMKEDIREEINRKLEAQDEEHINCR